MCLEQALNPYAFSVGNADRIFEPCYAKEGLSRKEVADLFKHFLVFFNVGDRSWAISQNVLISGRDVAGNDLTNEMSYAIFEILRKGGVAENDLPDYAVAGYQEPLIMGKDNGNTTNSWLNMGRILELTLNHGKSLITGKQMGPDFATPSTHLLYGYWTGATPEGRTGIWFSDFIRFKTSL